MNSATIKLPDGTTCTLSIDDAGLHLLLAKNGQQITIDGDESIYDLLSLITAMPWGEAGKL